MKKLLFLATTIPLLLCAQVVAAADPETPAPERTAPYRAPHKDTGEPGVWIPVWLQQVQLQTEAQLQTCSLEKVQVQSALAERSRAASASQRAAADLKAANTALETTLSVTELDLTTKTEESSDRLTWAWTSTGVAAVAVSVLIIVLTGK